MALRVATATRPWRTIDRHPVGTGELAQAIANKCKPPQAIPVCNPDHSPGSPLLFPGFWCVHPPPPQHMALTTPPGFGGLGFYFEVFRVALDLPPIGVSPPGVLLPEIGRGVANILVMLRAIPTMKSFIRSPPALHQIAFSTSTVPSPPVPSTPLEVCT